MRGPSRRCRAGTAHRARCAAAGARLGRRASVSRRLLPAPVADAGGRSARRVAFETARGSIPKSATPRRPAAYGDQRIADDPSRQGTPARRCVRTTTGGHDRDIHRRRRRHPGERLVSGRLAIVGGDAAGMSAREHGRRRPRRRRAGARARPVHVLLGVRDPVLRRRALRGLRPPRSAAQPDEHPASTGSTCASRCEVIAIDLAARTLTVRDRRRARRAPRGLRPARRRDRRRGRRRRPSRAPSAIEPARTIDAAERFLARLERSADRRAVVIGARLHRPRDGRGARAARAAGDADRARRAGHAARSTPTWPRTSRTPPRASASACCLGATLEESSPTRTARRSRCARRRDLPADHVVIGDRRATRDRARARRPASSSATAARCASTTTSAARATTASSPPATAPRAWHRVLDRPVNVQLGTHANKQGRIAGANATGADLAFPGVIGTAVVEDLPLRGRAHRASPSARRPTRASTVVSATIKDRTRAGYYPGAGPDLGQARRRRRDSGRLLGGQIVGVEGAAKRIDVLATRDLDRAWRSTSSRCSTSPTRRRSAASTTRCSSPLARPPAASGASTRRDRRDPRRCPAIALDGRVRKPRRATLRRRWPPPWRSASSDSRRRPVALLRRPQAAAVRTSRRGVAGHRDRRRR